MNKDEKLYCLTSQKITHFPVSRALYNRPFSLPFHLYFVIWLNYHFISCHSSLFLYFSPVLFTLSIQQNCYASVILWFIHHFYTILQFMYTVLPYFWFFQFSFLQNTPSLAPSSKHAETVNSRIIDSFLYKMHIWHFEHFSSLSIF